jgi:hypothetical protein
MPARSMNGYEVDFGETQRRPLASISISAISSVSTCLTMRLSDARLRRRQTKLLYPNHRLFSVSSRCSLRDAPASCLAADLSAHPYACVRCMHLTHALVRRRRPRGAPQRFASCSACGPARTVSLRSCFARGPADTSRVGVRHNVAHPCAVVRALALTRSVSRTLAQSAIERRRAAPPNALQGGPVGVRREAPNSPLPLPGGNFHHTIARTDG